jgi:hypothetical protein
MGSPEGDTMDLSSQSQLSDPGATPSYKGITFAGFGRDCPETGFIIPKRNRTHNIEYLFFISNSIYRLNYLLYFSITQQGMNFILYFLILLPPS